MAAAKEITVYIDWAVYQRMSYWAKLGGKKSREFTCFARTTIERYTNGGFFFWISEAYLVKHEGNSAAVEIDEDDMAALMFKLDQEGVPPDEAFACWVHSHPGRGPNATYLSGVDEENIKKFMEQGAEWLVAIVFDSQGEHPFVRVDFRSPVHHCVPAKLEIVYPRLDDAELKELEKEFEEKSSAKTYSYQTGKYSKGGGYNYGGYSSYSGSKYSKGSGSSKKSTVVTGFAGSGKAGSSDSHFIGEGLYSDELGNEDFWNEVQLSYEEYEENNADDAYPMIVGFEDAPDTGDISFENGAVEVYMPGEYDSTEEGEQVFEECVEAIALKVQIGHCTFDAGVEAVTRMGYERSKAERAMRQELGLAPDAEIP